MAAAASTAATGILTSADIRRRQLQGIWSERKTTTTTTTTTSRPSTCERLMRKRRAIKLGAVRENSSVPHSFIFGEFAQVEASI